MLILLWYHCALTFVFTLKVVKPELGASAKQGDPIVSSTIIRLQHSATRKWLHSHSFESPLSGNQEVCSQIKLLYSAHNLDIYFFF